jgi:redox-sensing transcriptional repressor
MKKISDSTIQRLSKYYRTLSRLIEKGSLTVSSTEMANLNNITSAQVRKDLSFFGTFGKRGLGYNCEKLKDHIAKILGIQKEWNVALVGFGNIGRALINYQEFKSQGFIIKSIFDSDPEKQNQIFSGIPVNDISQAAKIIKENRIEIVILAIPVAYAQDIVDKFVKYGIKAFLNFAPTSIKVPNNVLVKNENMSIELEALSFFLTNQK